MNNFLCVCGHHMDMHDVDEDRSGCLGRKTDGSACMCTAYYPGDSDRIEHKPPKLPLFAQRLTEDERRWFVKTHPQEGYPNEHDHGDETEND